MQRLVLGRDRHRCTTPGCGNGRFLEIHRVVPRAEDGANSPESLVTLCSRGQRHAHS